MVIGIILLSVVVLYLIAGACIGLMESKDIEGRIASLKEEGYDDDFIRGYKYGAYKVCVINGPVIYVLGFFGLYR